MTDSTENPASAPARRRRRKAPSASDVAIQEASSDNSFEESLKPAPRDEATVRKALLAMEQQLNASFIDRQAAIRCVILASVCGLNYLLVGGAGTAKTKLASCASKHFKNASFFNPDALGAYTTLSDLVGERDIPALTKEGIQRRNLDGRLASVEAAFLDELFKSADPTVNTLLTISNVDDDGGRRFDGKGVPLWTFGSATNWPEIVAMKPIVAAFWDRLHFRVPVHAVTGKESIRKLLRSGRDMKKSPYIPADDAMVTIDELRHVAINHIQHVGIDSDVEDMLISVQERLEREKIIVSGRRLVLLQFILQANAWLENRTQVGLMDFDILRFCLWSKKGDIEKVNAVVDSIDAELTRKLVNNLNKARELYRSSENKGWTLDGAQEFLLKASKSMEKAADALDSGSLRDQSIQDVKRAASKLKEEVTHVMNRYGESLQA